MRSVLMNHIFIIHKCVLQESKNKKRFYERNGNVYYVEKGKETDPDDCTFNFTVEIRYNVAADKATNESPGQACVICPADGGGKK